MTLKPAAVQTHASDKWIDGYISLVKRNSEYNPSPKCLNKTLPAFKC